MYWFNWFKATLTDFDRYIHSSLSYLKLATHCVISMIPPPPEVVSFYVKLMTTCRCENKITYIRCLYARLITFDIISLSIEHFLIDTLILCNITPDCPDVYIKI